MMTASRALVAGVLTPAWTRRGALESSSPTSRTGHPIPDAGPTWVRHPAPPSWSLVKPWTTYWDYHLPEVFLSIKSLFKNLLKMF